MNYFQCRFLLTDITQVALEAELVRSLFISPRDRTLSSDSFAKVFGYFAAACASALIMLRT